MSWSRGNGFEFRDLHCVNPSDFGNFGGWTSKVPKTIMPHGEVQVRVIQAPSYVLDSLGKCINEKSRACTQHAHNNRLRRRFNQQNGKERQDLPRALTKTTEVRCRRRSKFERAMRQSFARAPETLWLCPVILVSEMLVSLFGINRALGSFLAKFAGGKDNRQSSS